MIPALMLSISQQVVNPRNSRDTSLSDSNKGRAQALNSLFTHDLTVALSCVIYPPGLELKASSSKSPGGFC